MIGSKFSFLTNFVVFGNQLPFRVFDIASQSINTEFFEKFKSKAHRFLW